MRPASRETQVSELCDVVGRNCNGLSAFMSKLRSAKSGD